MNYIQKIYDSIFYFIIFILILYIMNKEHLYNYLKLCKSTNYETINNILNDIYLIKEDSHNNNISGGAYNISQKYGININQIYGLIAVKQNEIYLGKNVNGPKYVFDKYHQMKGGNPHNNINDHDDEENGDDEHGDDEHGDDDNEYNEDYKHDDEEYDDHDNEYNEHDEYGNNNDNDNDNDDNPLQNLSKFTQLAKQHITKNAKGYLKKQIDYHKKLLKPHLKKIVNHYIDDDNLSNAVMHITNHALKKITIPSHKLTSTTSSIRRQSPSHKLTSTTSSIRRQSPVHKSPSRNQSPSHRQSQVDKSPSRNNSPSHRLSPSHRQSQVHKSPSRNHSPSHRPSHIPSQVHKSPSQSHSHVHKSPSRNHSPSHRPTQVHKSPSHKPSHRHSPLRNHSPSHRPSQVHKSPSRRNHSPMHK